MTESIPSRDFEPWAIKELADPEVALHFLEESLEEYKNDNDANAMLNAIRVVSLAMGLKEESAATELSEHLSFNLPLVFSNMGYRIRLEQTESEMAY